MCAPTVMCCGPRSTCRNVADRGNATITRLSWLFGLWTLCIYIYIFCFNAAAGGSGFKAAVAWYFSKGTKGSGFGADMFHDSRFKAEIPGSSWKPDRRKSLHLSPGRGVRRHVLWSCEQQMLPMGNASNDDRLGRRMAQNCSSALVQQ